ncbi:MAG: GFA family protein [Kiloniellaceae bacterium]
MSDAKATQAGGCACGTVRYRAAGDLRPVVACHCSQCRKAFTNYGAFTAVRRDGLTIDNEDAVTWYDSSPGVRRGFCSRCGSALFWDNAANAYTSIAAGSVAQPSGLKQVRHIYVADKADFYDIGDGLEQAPQGQVGDPWPIDGPVEA